MTLGERYQYIFTKNSNFDKRKPFVVSGDDFQNQVIYFKIDFKVETSLPMFTIVFYSAGGVSDN